MELTGRFIQFTGALSLTILGGAFLYFLKRGWHVLSNFEDFKNEFESLHEKVQESPDEERDLLNLSLTYRALKKQLERNGELDEDLLDQALERAKQKRKIFSTNRKHNLYYAAWNKLHKLKAKASERGKV